jgi:alpha-galactosidase
MGTERLPNRSLTWDPAKFPEGMPALAAALHRRSLRLGLYSARCRRTCCDYPASFGHEVRRRR